MTTETDLNLYQRGLELAEAGRYEEALACIQQHLQRVPEDAQALNDAGAILHCLGRTAEAIDCLLRAKSRNGDCAQILWNLAEAYLADGRASEVTQLFGDMKRLGILNADVLNRTANVFLNQDNKADAIEVLLHCLQLWPEQEILKPMIEVIRSRRAKIAFFCKNSDDVRSLADIHAFAKTRFPTELSEGQSLDQMYDLMKWSDICWLEGCTDMAVEASMLPKVCKTVIRLHNDEAYDKWPTQVQWENIDVLITRGNRLVKEALFKQVPDIKNRTWIIAIPNSVNLDKFKFIGPPKAGRGKNLACVGNLDTKKNPMFLLQCMQKLHYIDREYKLFFAGSFQNLMLQQYIRHMVQALELIEVVFFDGWQEDVNSWLQDKHYIVSCNIGQGQSMGLLEGMACGLKPVIHNFPGASEMFPPEFLFNISEEFCQRVLSDQYEPEKYRRFVETNYPIKEHLSKINSILTQLEQECVTCPKD